MIKNNIDNFTRGWFIGNFDPALLKTDAFEVGYLFKPKGSEPPHYHAVATEYNVLVSGKMRLNDQEFVAGDMFIIDPNVVAYPVFHEDCYIICVKVPSAPNDKFLV